MDKIEEAASITAFVIVDLEGLASLMVTTQSQCPTWW